MIATGHRCSGAHHDRGECGCGLSPTLVGELELCVRRLPSFELAWRVSRRFSPRGHGPDALAAAHGSAG